MTKHGEFIDNPRGTREYWIWVGMRQRCENPGNSGWKWYGARGIKVCDRWHGFTSFIEDMGRPPTTKHTIDRINPDGDYQPDNCRWADAVEQANNRTNALFPGVNLREAAAVLGLSYSGLYGRVARGWPLDQIIGTPSKASGAAHYKAQRARRAVNF